MAGMGHGEQYYLQHPDRARAGAMGRGILELLRLGLGVRVQGAHTANQVPLGCSSAHHRLLSCGLVMSMVLGGSSTHHLELQQYGPGCRLCGEEMVVIGVRQLLEGVLGRCWGSSICSRQVAHTHHITRHKVLAGAKGGSSGGKCTAWGT